jgi:transcriptional regulator with XRE-family HTH domain
MNSLTKKEFEGIAKRFKAVRNTLSQRGMARLLSDKSVKIHHSMISEVEAGIRMPSKNTMIALAKQYKVSINWLLLGGNRPKWG